MNKIHLSFEKKFSTYLKKGFSLALTASLILGGFFIFSSVYAAHTVSVHYTVNGIETDTVKGNTPATYEFTITNESGDGIAHVKIEQADFVNFTSLSCPFGWEAETGEGTFAECSWVFGKDLITNEAIISFTATTPGTSGLRNWTVTTDDLVGGQNILTPQIEVDATPPTVELITTKDTNGDGKIETATILFSEPIDDSTFLASDFTLGEVQADTIESGITNDNTFDIILAEEVEGTEAKDVTYTQGTGADLVGNLLANVASGDITEIDGADPIFISATATNDTNVSILFSETISIVGTPDWGTAVTAATLTATNGVVNGSTLNVTVNSLNNTAYTASDLTISEGVVEDAASNQNAAISEETITDGQVPIISSTETISITEIEVTFSEPMNAVLADDFLVSENTVQNIVLVGGDNTKAIITLTAEIGTGDTPDISTVAAPMGTEDSAGNLITGGLVSTPTDGINPLVTSAMAAPDPAKDGIVTITVVFSENMNTEISPTVEVTGITGSPVAVSQSSYSGTSWEGTFTLEDNDEEIPATISVVGATDSVGNTMADNLSAGTFNVDTIEPTGYTVSIDQLYINDANKNEMSFTFAEAEVDTTYTYSIDDTNSGTPAVTDTGTITTATDQIDGINVSSLDDDTLTLTVYLTDVAGNKGTDTTDIVTKDTVAPVITSIISDATSAGWLKVGDSITFTLTPGQTELDAVVAGSYNGVELSWSTSDGGQTYTAIYTISEGDTDQMSPLQISGVVITDAAGNASALGAGSDVAKTIDANTPSAPSALILTDPINLSNQTAVSITGTGEANALVDYSIDDTNNLTVPVTGSDTVDGSGNINVTGINVLTLNDDILTASVTLTDTAGNTSDPGSDTATKDIVAPEVNITSPLAESKVKGNALITFTDNELTAPQCSVDDTSWVACTSGETELSDIPEFAELDQDTFTLYLKDTDSAGNTGVDSEVGIVKDTVAPSVEITYNPVSPVKAGDVIVTATYSEAIVGTPQISINQQGTEDIANADMIDSGDQTTWTYAYAVHSDNGVEYVDGEAVVSLSIVADAAGNNAEVPGEGTTFVIDTTVPIAEITSPVTDDVIKSSDVSLEYTASDTNTITCYYKIDEGVEVEITNCASPASISGLTDGRRTITLIVRDAAGNEATDDVSIVIDLDNTLDVPADFITIQDAIDAATEGDTINVGDGTYNERLTITKQLTLTGTDKTTAIIQPIAVPVAGEYDVQIYASGVIIQDFTFDFDGTDGDRGISNGTGIVIGEVGEPYPVVENVQISNNIIYSAAVAIQSGLDIDVDGLNILDNIIFLDEDGDGDLSAWDVAGIYINPNSGDGSIAVTNNTINGHIGYGIATEADNTDISGNTINNTMGSGDKAGIRYIDWYGNTHTGVTISGNTVQNMPKGIWVNSGQGSGSLSGNVQYNTLSNNDIGIWLGVNGPTTNLSINYNNVSGNISYGLQNQSEVNINAESNWWGDASGPSGQGSGSGDIVSTYVDYAPWLEDTKDSAPVRDNGQPADYTNTADPTLSLDTDRDATCRYSQTPETDYDSMTHFTTTGETSHSTALSGLAEGEHTYYVKCKSNIGEGTAVNSDDYGISFTVDITYPIITFRTPGINAAGVDATTNVIIEFNEDVKCTNDDGIWENCISLDSVSGSADYNSDTYTLTFEPDSPLDSNTEFTVALTEVTDLAVNSLSGVTTWKFTTATYYSIAITNGWNLISIPTVPVDISISEVLGDAASKIDSVWMYDVVDDEWYVYHPDGSSSNLSSMTAGYGYWISATGDDAIEGYGSLFNEQQTPPQRQLVGGWNLIGYYQNEGIEGIAVNKALSTLSDNYTDATKKWWTSLVSYDNTGKTFTTVGFSDTISPGDGFWIFMKSSTITYMYGPGESE